MHGITHLYRQHAVEKQLSGGESWSRQIYPGYSSSADASSQGSRLYSVDSSSSSSSNSNNSGGGAGGAAAGENLGGVTGSAYAQWQSDRHSLPQAVPDAPRSLANHHYRNSPTHHAHHQQQPTSGSLKRTPSSKRSFLERSHSPAIYGSMRRSAAPDFGSPPSTAPVGGGGYFPHDLDDIYESQGDHQYFTHTGASGQQQQRPTAISIFHRVSAAHTSLDDYTLPGESSRQSMNSTDSGTSSGPFSRQRFDNSSFVKSISIEEQEQQHSPHKEGHSKHGKHHHHHHHHHHSIHELVKHFGKKMHLWPRKHHDAQSVCTSPQNDPQENFRTRSKSLDVNTLSRPNRILDDCGATYKIFDRIVKEGAHMRRASADLEKRRASVGAAGRGLRGDGTLDPHHAAILFRDSRGCLLFESGFFMYRRRYSAFESSTPRVGVLPSPPPQHVIAPKTPPKLSVHFDPNLPKDNDSNNNLCSENANAKNGRKARSLSNSPQYHRKKRYGHLPSLMANNGPTASSNYQLLNSSNLRDLVDGQRHSQHVSRRDDNNGSMQQTLVYERRRVSSAHSSPSPSHHSPVHQCLLMRRRSDYSVEQIEQWKRQQQLLPRSGRKISHYYL
ncbi:hypothetical protein M5D96_001046 [Drosophila gunungcola]|uniref:Uncharacterized protein n=1 Tax=Drosophila gunungcola TaxID=103775 RepID=A0A9Q0BUP2_9MUSC|nr:hypothetical protein M5D96_001046 [Drosophila gunungcola]